MKCLKGSVNSTLLPYAGLGQAPFDKVNKTYNLKEQKRSHSLWVWTYSQVEGKKKCTFYLSASHYAFPDAEKVKGGQESLRKFQWEIQVGKWDSH